MARYGPIRAVLFDLDGTLLDSAAQFDRALAEALAEHGQYALPDGALHALMGLPGEEVLRQLGVSPEDTADVLSRWIAWESRTAHLARPFPAAAELLQQVRTAGRALAIVTTRPRASIASTPAARNLTAQVDVVVTRDDTPQGKPHPAPVLRALERLGVAPRQAIYAGDSAYDVEAGKRAGCLMVWIARPGTTLPPSGYRPDHRVSTLEELAELLARQIGASKRKEGNV